MAKNDKQEKSKRIYTTEIINKLLEDAGKGLEIDTSPFFMGDLELRDANIVFQYTEEEIEEFQKCAQDPIYFTAKYCKFQNDKGRTTVKLRDFQEDTLHMLCDQHYDEELDEMIPDNRNCIIMASRQTGKTTTTAAFMAWYLCFHYDRNIMALANKQTTAVEIVDKVIQIFRGLPFWLKPGAINFGKMGVTLDNGCRLLSSATTASTSIGFTIHVLYIDEMAHIPSNIIEPFWRSVYPTMSSSRLSQCIITSTPNGQNMFYDIFTKSDIGTGENSFKGKRIDYWQVPGHDDAWAAQMRIDFGDKLFAQEFELQFTVNASMLLKGSDLQFMDRLKMNYGNKTMFNHELLKTHKLRWHPNFDPYNINPNDKFLLSVDLSEGKEYDDNVSEKIREGTDYNIINIFKIIPNSLGNIRTKNFNKKVESKDCYKCVQIGIFEDNEHDEAFCADMTNAILYTIFETQLHDNTRVMVEMNFQGKNYVTHMQKDINFADDIIIKTYHSEPVPGEKRKKKFGFKTTSTKEYYCKKGAKMIEDRRLIISDVRSIKQLAAFGKVKGKLEGIAMHDDISVTILNAVPRAFEEEAFIGWLEDLIENNPDKLYKYNLNQIIQKWELDNPEMSDSYFNSLINDNRINYTELINSQMNQSYSQLMNRYRK